MTPEQLDEICAKLASGESVKQLDRDGLIKERDFYRMMAGDEAFRSRIVRAREAQQEYEADQCVNMADEATPEDWQVVKLRIWARQWRASKLAPKKYGDKVQAEVTGRDGGALTVQIVRHGDATGD